MHNEPLQRKRGKFFYLKCFFVVVFSDHKIKKLNLLLLNVYQVQHFHEIFELCPTVAMKWLLIPKCFRFMPVTLVVLFTLVSVLSFNPLEPKTMNLLLYIILKDYLLTWYHFNQHITLYVIITLFCHFSMFYLHNRHKITQK